MSVSDYIFVIMCLAACYVALIGNLVLWWVIDKKLRTYTKIIDKKENKDE